jgi:ATP-dependent RNA helicase RhlE
MNLSGPLLNAIASEGYETPTPIQAQAIPLVLEGRDILGCAQTGTGKTAAFALPVLERLHRAKENTTRDGRCLPKVLILSPTRELACQIEQSIRTYGRRTHTRQALIYGGVSQHRQVGQLQSGVDIIVATPGRLMDLMEQGHVDLTGIEILVLDEADRMLDMGFIKPIRKIASEIPESRQTLLFSATMPSSIVKLANSLLRKPARITVTPDVSDTPNIQQSLYLPGQTHKPQLLAHLIRDKDMKRAVVFTRTKHGADRLVKFLARQGLSSTAIHGNKSQNQRNRALGEFRSGNSPVLVATDVAARGLDVDGITHVFNYDLPNEAEAYIHRIGRTGRAGATGTAISFCSRDERSNLRDIERLLENEIDTLDLPENLGIQPEEAGARDSNGGHKGGNRGGGGRKSPRRQQRSPRGSSTGNKKAVTTKSKRTRSRRAASGGRGR